MRRDKSRKEISKFGSYKSAYMKESQEAKQFAVQTLGRLGCMARLKTESFIVSLHKNSDPDIPHPTPHRQIHIQLKIFLLVSTSTFKTVCFQFGKLILTNVFKSL